jgi:hypothetical protein
MKKNSFDLSGRIEPSLLDVVEVVTQVAGPLSIPFFLIGAWKMKLEIKVDASL